MCSIHNKISMFRFQDFRPIWFFRLSRLHKRHWQLVVFTALGICNQRINDPRVKISLLSIPTILLERRWKLWSVKTPTQPERSQITERSNQPNHFWTIAPISYIWTEHLNDGCIWFMNGSMMLWMEQRGTRPTRKHQIPSGIMRFREWSNFRKLSE